MPRRRHASEDDEAWADRHEGDCAVGQIHELRESNPPGKPFEPVRGPLGFLEWDGDALRSPTRKRKKRNGKP